jgi:hypothetical protein
MTAADVTTVPDDAFAHSLRGTIEGLRYWVPSIIDAARVAEESAPQYWHLSIAPRSPGGCPFELLLRQDRRFDAVVAGQSYEDRSITSLSLFLALAEAIIDGRVIQRRWLSTQTGTLSAVETLVFLSDGSVWRDGNAPLGPCESRDRHFLPYRR